jgi:xylose isomerase
MKNKKSNKINVTTGDKAYFPNIPAIPFEGNDSDNPLAFRWYEEDLQVGDKTMREHFKFAVAWWHSLCGTGGDPFGAPTKNFPWHTASDPLELARDRVDAGFEFITKMGIPYFCFHDYDLVAEGASLTESRERLEIITDYVREKQKASGVKLLWGTANLFSQPRYMNGAMTNPDFEVVALRVRR